MSAKSEHRQKRQKTTLRWNEWNKRISDQIQYFLYGSAILDYLYPCTWIQDGWTIMRKLWPSIKNVALYLILFLKSFAPIKSKIHHLDRSLNAKVDDMNTISIFQFPKSILLDQRNTIKVLSVNLLAHWHGF